MRADPVVGETRIWGFIILLLIEMDLDAVLLEGMHELLVFLDGSGCDLVDGELGLVHELVVLCCFGVQEEFGGLDSYHTFGKEAGHVSSREISQH